MAFAALLATADGGVGPEGARPFIRCAVCREVKPSSEYAPSHARKGSGPCRPCKAAKQRIRYAAALDKERARKAAYREANREAIRERNRSHRKKGAVKRRDYALRTTFGIGVAEYDGLFAAQGGRCACCGDPASAFRKRLAVDHDHRTGAVRGLLCTRCNQGLGMFLDDPERLAAAMLYLARARGR